MQLFQTKLPVSRIRKKGGPQQLPLELKLPVSEKLISYLLNNFLINSSPKSNTIAQITKNHQPKPFQYVVAITDITKYHANFTNQYKYLI